MRPVVQVQGLADFARAVRAVDKESAKALRVAMNGCATFLINKAKPKIPKRTGRAADSLKARSTQKAVRIAIGGRRAPYYPWLDFGGRTGPHRSVVRPFQSDGRYLYPTLADSRGEFQRIMEQAIARVAQDAGLDVD
jgi:hypothetical protein